MAEEKKTWQDWNKELGAGIMDPDGFDRTDPDKTYTRQEFEQNVSACTCQFHGSPFWEKRFKKLNHEIHQAR